MLHRIKKKKIYHKVMTQKFHISPHLWYETTEGNFSKDIFSPKVQPHSEGEELPTTKLNTSCARGKVFKRKKKIKQIPWISRLLTQNNELTGGNETHSGACSTLKKDIISLDFLRHLPEKKAIGETHSHVKNTQMHTFKNGNNIFKSCNTTQ